MLSHALTGICWFLSLFDPPPLESMNWRQKIGRVITVTIALVIMCILFAMFAAVALYLEDCGRQMLMNTPHLIHGLVIIFVGIAVNSICVTVLMMIRRMDDKLLPPSS